MNELSKFLTEQILLEDTVPNLLTPVVVFSGRFQPMQPGHYASYVNLVNKFGKENVYIGTSNKVESGKSPFNFKEKKSIMTSLFDVPSKQIVQIKNPYKPTEILSKYNPDTTSFVTVVGEKDTNRLTSKFWTKYDGNFTKGYNDGGYVYIMPPQAGGISASEIRIGLSTGDESDKIKFFNKVYPKFNQSVYNMIDGKLNESFIISKHTIEEWMINENTKTGAGQDDDGPASFHPNYDVYSRVSVDRAKKIGYDVVNMITTKEVEDYYEHPNYPDGPVKAVSYFPAGVIGAMTPNNQIDIYSSGAYSEWFTHVTRTATLAGYSLVQTQLERESSKILKNLSGKDAKGAKELEEEFETLMNESITLPIEIGDTLLMGKWKNKPVVVKTIGKDDHGMPTINGKKVVTFRFGKKAPNIFDNIVELEEDIDVKFSNLGILRKDMPQIKSTDVSDFLKFVKGKNISYTVKNKPIKSFKLTQKDINIDKVKSMMSAPNKVLNKPVLGSNDDYVMDGHHRILGKYNNNKSSKIKTIEINVPISQLLQLAKEYPKTTYKGINEMITEGNEKLKISIPPNIKKLHKVFKKNGKKLYVVGGAVRDAILGKSPKDWDLATDAKPDEVLDIAKKEGLHTTEVGKQFGVVIIDGDEVATFRKDIGKGRRPDTVDYTDIYGDVKRRDLTINALFYDMDRSEIVDLVGGIKDLQDKQIRTVGEPVARFEEDPLRKLRAFRFNARMGGTMEKGTMQALKDDPSLKGVSSERIRDEFLKSIKTAKSTKSYLELTEKLGYLKLILPNVKISKPFINEPDSTVLLSYLLRDNDVNTLKKVLNKINYSKEEIRDIGFLISLKDFNEKIVRIYKKDQELSKLSDEQIIKYAKLINIDLKKFLKFKTSVKGGDVPSELKGKEIQNWIDMKETEKYLNEIITEMNKPELLSVEKYADKQLNPTDIQFTKHFFDRVNDPRNKKEINVVELTGFFKRLTKYKKHFKTFLSKYREFVVKDKRTNINIPFVNLANKIIAKTIMRKSDFKTNSPEYVIELKQLHEISKHVKNMQINEDDIKGGLSDNMSLQDIANKHNIDVDELLPEFRMGIKVEMEHTNDSKLSAEITMDHLFELPDYYTRLKKVEETLHESLNKSFELLMESK